MWFYAIALPWYGVTAITGERGASMRSTDYISHTISRDLRQRSRPASTRPIDEIRTVPDVWYYADQNRPVGPLTFEGLLAKLLTLSNAADALVWCDRFSGWRRAGGVSEIKPHILVPPPLPGSVLAQPPSFGEVGNTSNHDQGPWKWQSRAASCGAAFRKSCRRKPPWSQRIGALIRRASG